MKVNQLLSEEKFEDYFCKKLEENKKYIQRDNKNTEKELHIDFDLLEKFLNKTQEDEFNRFKETYGNWKPKFEQAIKNELNNKELIQIIQDGITIEATYQFKLIYTKNTTSFNKEQEKLVKENIFSYIRQYKFDINSDQSIDVVLFLNGLPIITIELKYKQKGQDVYSATKQYQDRDLTQNIFNLPFLHIASDNDNVRIATKFYTKTTKDFMPFNVDVINPTIENDPYRTQYLYNDVLTPISLLELIRNFIFVDKNKKLIFPRYHQRRVVNNLVKDISSKYKNSKNLNMKFLIEHSMGSGKSKTITWTAEQLKNLHIDNKKVFNSIFIITDRKELNTQISDDFKLMTGNDNDTICYVENSKQLSEAIQRDEKVIVVILHNFTYLNKEDLNMKKDNRICYLIDETHRSQQGKLHSSMIDFFEKIGDEDMKLNFPNSVFIGFTATPTDKTLEKFGTKNEQGKYIAYDTYSMEQAIKEGYILDVTQNIIPFRTLYKLRKDSEDKLFEKEYNALQVYRATKKKAFEDPNIIRYKVRIILHYFKDKIQNAIEGKAKSMIITSSRKSAIAYKKIMDEEILNLKYNIKTLVAFSGKESHKELEIENQTENSLNNFNGNIAEEFKKDEYRFLIVADKYQTGFDEPYLFAMFLDKSIKNIGAVQTLGRLNRVCPMKPQYPITVDFSNSYEDIKSAFKKFMKSRDSDIVTDYSELVALYQNIMQKGILSIDNFDEFEVISQLSDDVFQIKYELFVNKIKDKYFKSDKITKNEFRKNLGKFGRSYSYMNTIIKIDDRNIKLLGILAKQLYLGLNENDGSKEEIRNALENLKIEKYNVVAVEKREYQDGRKGTLNKVKEREISKLTINEIIELIEENYDTFTYSKEGKKLFEEYLKTLIDDKDLRKKILNTPLSEKDQNKKSILNDLNKRIKSHLFKTEEGFNLLEKYKNTDILEKLNEQAYFLLEDEYGRNV